MIENKAAKQRKIRNYTTSAKIIVHTNCTRVSTTSSSSELVVLVPFVFCFFPLPVTYSIYFANKGAKVDQLKPSEQRT